MHKVAKDQGKKRRIDAVRTRAGSASIPDGFGNIVVGNGIRERLYMIAQRGICSSVFADQIDPERLNIDLPLLVQRVDLHYGTDTIFIQRTICLGVELLKSGFLPKDLDVEQALEICLESAYLFGGIQDNLNELLAEQAKIKDEDAEEQIRRDLLPQLPRLQSRTKQSIESLRELSNSIKALTLLFYPKVQMGKNEPWELPFKAAAVSARGNDDRFIRQLEAKLAFLFDVDSFRNALVHPDGKKWVKILNYEIQQDGTIIPPTIELESEQFKIPRMDLANVLAQIVEHMSAVFEYFLCVLCDLSAIKFGDSMGFGIVELPD